MSDHILSKTKVVNNADTMCFRNFVANWIMFFDKYGNTIVKIPYEEDKLVDKPKGFSCEYIGIQDGIIYIKCLSE